MKQLRMAWNEIQPTGVLREAAKRMLRLHALRAVDALQLAAALTAAEQHPDALDMVCLDQRLCEAARREGFRLLPE